MSAKLKKSDLLKMIQDLQDRVRRLENQPAHPQNPFYPQEIITIPSVWPVDQGCIGGQPHDYPTPWFGTVPPSCRRCGKPGQSFTITCQDGKSESFTEVVLEDGTRTPEQSPIISCGCGPGAKHNCCKPDKNYTNQDPDLK